GRLCGEGLMGALEVVRLHLDRLVERFGGHQLFGRGGTLLERLLGIVRHLRRDRLEALREYAKRLERGVDTVLAELLHIVEILDHDENLSRPDLAVSLLSPPRRILAPRTGGS